MGRLDEIVARNQRAMNGDSPLVQVMDKVGGDDKPPAPVAPFTLPSQRKSGTKLWKVLVLMVLIVIGYAIFDRLTQSTIKADDERRLREVR
ncbi:MAG TPA: hypothetical protein VGG74_23175 [Kofleriaceae bacterium]|jgi:hypothetical protein